MRWTWYLDISRSRYLEIRPGYLEISLDTATTAWCKHGWLCGWFTRNTHTNLRYSVNQSVMLQAKNSKLALTRFTKGQLSQVSQVSRYKLSLITACRHPRWPNISHPWLSSSIYHHLSHLNITNSDAGVCMMAYHELYHLTLLPVRFWSISRPLSSD